ncbi:uncharacterized protein H6S33_003745 [Morchella sextelata]|uniref:uncharacterized protein n=1 Tax=Morchella sextelata TaxID=1174677 RepID=UPI001D055DD2|nr:uncharacterized protein H6S33_003745 [Morchella sextelata]KAH0606084.1 hypothetical protein H6S33_003745 [Morchella sextelata]
MAGNPSQLAGPFSDTTRVAFNLYIADPISRNRFYISESDYVMLTDFYLNPTKSAKTVKADNLKYRSKTEFVLKEGRLQKRIGDGDLCNQLPGIDKTYKNIRECYFGIIKFFGPSIILQCDNGSEFKGALLTILQKFGIKIINGRPRHLQSQALIEQYQTTTRNTPYEIVFKQHPNPNNRILPRFREYAQVKDRSVADINMIKIKRLHSNATQVDNSIPIGPTVLNSTHEIEPIE